MENSSFNKQNPVQSALDAKYRNRLISTTTIMIGTSLARFLGTGFLEVNYQPLSFSIDLNQFDDLLLRRIIRGLGTAPAPPYPHHIKYGDLVYEDSNGLLLKHKWDLIGDSEKPEEYLKRHFAKMDIVEIINIPKEPSFMQINIAVHWAQQIGFSVDLETIQNFARSHGILIAGEPHVFTNRFFEFCMEEYDKK